MLLRLGQPDFDRGKLARNAVRPEIYQEVELRAARSLGASIGQIDDLPLPYPVDAGMRLVDEALRGLRIANDTAEPA